jgi:hypothetical protein
VPAIASQSAAASNPATSAEVSSGKAAPSTSASGVAATEIGTTLAGSPPCPSAFAGPDGAEHAHSAKKAAGAAQIIFGKAVPMRRKSHS